jgi:hypothetical protein
MHQNMQLSRGQLCGVCHAFSVAFWTLLEQVEAIVLPMKTSADQAIAQAHLEVHFSVHVCIPR